MVVLTILSQLPNWECYIFLNVMCIFLMLISWIFDMRHINVPLVILIIIFIIDYY